MIDIKQIRQAYSGNLHQFDRSLFREYLQYQILTILFSHALSRKLSFLGDSCLRIVYNLPRFSEDLDFDNDKLTEDEFKTLSIFLQKELEKIGYEVEIKIISHQAFHCYIKFPKLLFANKLSSQKYEKILIKIDSFDQEVEYKTDLFILDKFEFFTQIKVTPKSVILSQKLWTITQRNRLKGRDFFDIMFLLQTTKPDLAFLQAKFGKKSLEEIVRQIISLLNDVDWKLLVNDVKPFLLNPKQTKKIEYFLQFLEQELLKNT